MAFTEADVATVETAIINFASRGGVRDLSIGGKRVTYASVKELTELLSVIRREVYAADNEVTKASFRYFRT